MSLTLNALGKNLTRNTAKMHKLSGASLKQMAELTGVSYRTLTRIQKAKQARRSYNPMLKTAFRLSNAAGVTVDDFIKGKLDLRTLLVPV